MRIPFVELQTDGVFVLRLGDKLLELADNVVVLDNGERVRLADDSVWNIQ